MLGYVVSCISYAFIGMPMYKLFRNGPAMLGFWQGKDDPEICAELTNTDAGFWKVNQSECGSLIEKKFNSIYTVSMVTVYSYLLLNAVQITFRCWMMRWITRREHDNLLLSLYNCDRTARTDSASTSLRPRSGSELRLKRSPCSCISDSGTSLSSPR
jgi:hypothetical protein